MEPVVVYSAANCGYCTRAKRLLEERGRPYEEVDLTVDDAGRRWLVEQTGRTTVPQIRVGTRWIGGYDDLRRLVTDPEAAARAGL